MTTRHYAGITLRHDTIDNPEEVTSIYKYSTPIIKPQASNIKLLNYLNYSLMTLSITKLYSWLAHVSYSTHSSLNQPIHNSPT